MAFWGKQNGPSALCSVVITLTVLCMPSVITVSILSVDWTLSLLTPLPYFEGVPPRDETGHSTCLKTAGRGTCCNGMVGQTEPLIRIYHNKN